MYLWDRSLRLFLEGQDLTRDRLVHRLLRGSSRSNSCEKLKAPSVVRFRITFSYRIMSLCSIITNMSAVLSRIRCSTTSRKTTIFEVASGENCRLPLAQKLSISFAFLATEQFAPIFQFWRILVVFKAHLGEFRHCRRLRVFDGTTQAIRVYVIES